ncbi:MAG: DUF885 domain-containing protein [Pseudomonadota bacterium]
MGIAAGINVARAETAQDSTVEATQRDALNTLLDDYWSRRLARDPVLATNLGVRDYDHRLSDESLVAINDNLQTAKAFRIRLNAIDLSALPPDDRLNADILADRLDMRIARGAFGERYMPITNRSGPHVYLTALPERLPFFTIADYESYISRLNDAPRFMAGVIERLAKGVETGWVMPCKAMQRYETSIAHHLNLSTEESAFFGPFKKRPANLSKQAWRRLQKAGARAIEDHAIPTIQSFYDFYTERYQPACRTSLAASDLPGGSAYYAFRVRRYTTTEETPDAIHALGLKEVARIRKEMDAVMRETGFQGDFKAFQEFLREAPQFYAKSAQELMALNALAAKRMDGELPKLFTRLPRAPYTLKEIPADIAEVTTTAYYTRPAGDGSRPGVYWINTSKLETRPLFEVAALTLHEAVPGHHLQIALAQEIDAPAFRRYDGETAFIEGWALYAERLGLDVGFYDDPYANFGRLSYEMWRACRLVVDTGIHAKGWTRDEAIAFMAENTALSIHNIAAEVDRYIAWPGQALAYKMGELTIRRLRARAEARLGSDYDLRRFHDAVLAAGATPLGVLEARIEAWINDLIETERQAQTAPSQN